MGENVGVNRYKKLSLNIEIQISMLEIEHAFLVVYDNMNQNDQLKGYIISNKKKKIK